MTEEQPEQGQRKVPIGLTVGAFSTAAIVL